MTQKYTLDNNNIDKISIVVYQGERTIAKNNIMIGTITTTSFTSSYSSSIFGSEATAIYSGSYLVSKNTIKLPSVSSSEIGRAHV